MRRLRNAATLAVVTAVGCTFGGLGRYDVPKCNSPKSPTSLADDPCADLNPPGNACEVYQCNDATGTCQKRARDFDRDGDPSLECGGHDCDDKDPSRTGLGGADVCDGIDNDCSGTADDNLVSFLSNLNTVRVAPVEPSLSSDGEDVTYADVVGGSATGPCITALRVDTPHKTAHCTLLLPALSDPHHPWARPLLGTTAPEFGAVFVDTAAPCTTGALRYRDTQGGELREPCAAGGASLPSFVPYADGRTFVVSYIGAPVAERNDPLTQCAAAPAAPLHIQWLRHNARVDPIEVYAQRLNLTTSLSLRPAAMVPFDDAVLLAAPADKSVGLWALRAPEPDGSGNAVVPLLEATSIGALAGARSASIAVGSSRLAIAAELGCTPNQRLAFAVSRIRTPGLIVEPPKVIEVPTDTPALAAPRVAWIAQRNEWWLAWVAQTQTSERSLRLQRFSAEGVLAGAPLKAPLAVTMAAPRARAASNLAVSVATVDGKGLGEARFGCP